MGKSIVLPGLAVLGGVLGFGIRRGQWAVSYDSTTQLFLPGHPITIGLILLMAVLVLAFLLLLRGIPHPKAGLSPFRCPSPTYMTLMAASGLLFLGSGALGLLEGLDQLTLWRANPDSQVLTYPMALILCALLSFAAGPATLMLGRSAYRGEASSNLSVWVNLPPLAGLVWVFASHLAHGTDPALLGYGISLAAAVFLLLAHYEGAAFFFDRSHPFRAAFSALLGSTLGLISLADALSPFQMALTIAFVLSALANTWALLHNTFGPPWPKRLLEARPPREVQKDEEEDEDDHLDL